MESNLVVSRIQDLETRSPWQENQVAENVRKLERVIKDQKADIQRLQDLVYRIMHKNRVGQAEVGAQHPTARLRSRSVTGYLD